MSLPFESSTARSLQVRRRPDLVVSPQRYAHRRYWVLKDPVSLRYVRLNEHEYGIWQALDGQISLDQLKQDFERQFAPLQLTQRQLQSFLADLHRKGLVLADAWGQGAELVQRERRSRNRERLQLLSSVLAVRFRGINPDALLDGLYTFAQPLFSRIFLAFSLLLVLLAVTLVAVQFDTLQSRLPQFEAFFSATNIIWISVTLAAIKILHELGHGLTCRHFGGRCHELGVMFLVFVPCLYCNVSDAWMLPNKWHRIAVTAAGVWVEVTLAALCTLLWWFSEPGLLNTLCLNAMFVCSVSTLLFNGNPLLRYDGYYILADWLETPNLWQLSRDYLRSIARRWCLGVRRHEDLAWTTARRELLVVYGLASTVYRWFVLAGILVFLFGVLKPYRLEVVAQMVLGLVAVGVLATPVQQGWRFMSSLSNRRDVHRGRLLVTALILAAVIAGISLIPAPHHITAPLVVQAAGASPVYVSVPGILREIHVQAGQFVAAGDPLARLANEELAKEIARLRGELSTQQTRLANLQTRRGSDPEAPSQIPTAEKMLADLQQQLKKTQQEFSKLDLLAPADGQVLPPPAVEPTDAEDTGKLATWSGTPLDSKNLGSTLDTGALFCLIGDPSAVEAVLYIDQSDVAYVREGQSVRLKLDALPGEVLDGEVIELARRDTKVAPRELAQQVLPVEVDADGIAHPIDATYQARVHLAATKRQLPLSSRGQAKIEVASQTLGKRLLRYLNQTFTFQL